MNYWVAILNWHRASLGWRDSTLHKRNSLDHIGPAPHTSSYILVYIAKNLENLLLMNHWSECILCRCFFVFSDIQNGL